MGALRHSCKQGMCALRMFHRESGCKDLANSHVLMFACGVKSEHDALRDSSEATSVTSNVQIMSSRLSGF